MALVLEEHFGIARKIVSNMTVESWEEIPHGVLNYKPEVTEFLKECKKLNEGVTDKSKKITINTVMMKVICEGLKAAPKMNAHLEFQRRLVRGCLKVYDDINISMPIVLPETGQMMTINMHDMGNKTLTEMTAQINDSICRAKNTNLDEVMYQVSLNYTLEGLKKGNVRQAIDKLIGSKTGKHKVTNLKGKAKKDYYAIPETERLSRHDIDQGTTTISNLGSINRGFRGESTLLEIVPPQVSTFGVNSAQRVPIVQVNDKGEEEIVIGTIMPITVAIDHRALDYGDIVPFFQKLDEIFANPSILQTWK